MGEAVMKWQVLACLLVPIATYIFGYVVGRLRRRFYLNRYGLSLLLVVALLSGCLTAQKALVWSDTVTAWGTKPGASQECKRASLDAAKYLSNANRHIGSAKGLDDLPSRTEAKRLMDDAAKKCNEKY